MKKIIAILAVLSAVISFASCSVKSDKTTAELVAEGEAERSMAVQESIKAEEQLSLNVNDSVDEIGKTKNKEQIVIKVPYAHGDHYQVYLFNRKGICEKMHDYYYYSTNELFELNNEKQKEKTRFKKIDSDAEARMVVFESEYDIEGRNTYDQLYEFFTGENFAESGYEIIE